MQTVFHENREMPVVSKGTFAEIGFDSLYSRLGEAFAFHMPLESLESRSDDGLTTDSPRD